MSVLEALILGAVQGFTEYLPVSSSGHLVLGRELLGIDEPDLFFDVLVHVATLVVTVVFYSGPIVAMLRDTFGGMTELGRGERPSTVVERRQGLRLSVYILAGTVPTGLIGVVFKDPLESLFANPSAACSMLLVTAGLLVATRFTSATGRGDGEMRLSDALLVGLVQGCAIVPGISRSGSTIAAALILGLDRELAARFSFLLSVPAILGALVLKLGELPSDPSRQGVAVLSLGFGAALVTGFIALIALLPLVRRGQLHWFAFYLVPVALTGLILLR